jgi:biotin synthase
MLLEVSKLTEQVKNGEPPSVAQGMEILTARGATLTAYLAGAHRLREFFFGDRIELCSIINAKSGRCPENCAFCAQSAHYTTEAPVYPLKSLEEIVAGAQRAEAEGSHCFGIVTSGARIDHGEELDTILAAIRTIRNKTALAPSVSLGILDSTTAQALADAGCVTYHHNLETARSFFPQICSTHDYEEDVETIRIARKSGMKVCSGGILGLGESLEQRIELAETLRQLDVNSVPLNFLNPIQGTPLSNQRALTPMDCLRSIAMFRYWLPRLPIRVCGGREGNLREFQSWIFMAGATGTMVGNYLTTSGRDRNTDMLMIRDAEVEIDAC